MDRGNRIKNNPIDEYCNINIKDIIVLKYNNSITTLEEVEHTFDRLQKHFQDNKVIAIPKDLDIDICDKDVIIEHLENLIKILKE